MLLQAVSIHFKNSALYGDSWSSHGSNLHSGGGPVHARVPIHAHP